jgi:hypothetical protein
MVVVTCRLGTQTIDIATPSGIVFARHQAAGDGGGVMIRDHHHVTALDHAAMRAFNDLPAHRRKQRIPPGPAARACADVITGHVNTTDVVTDLAVYVEAAKQRNTLT